MKGFIAWPQTICHKKDYSHKWRLAAIAQKVAARRTIASAIDLVRSAMEVAGALTALMWRS